MNSSTASTASGTSATSRDAVPTGMLAALGAMVLATLLAVCFVRLTGIGAVHVPDAPAVSVREFRFEDRDDGGITVRDARDNHIVHTVAPETNGFLRGTMRGLARERHRRNIGPEVPFRMVGRADGKLTLEDPTTGRRVDLGSFGPTNAAVFAGLMTEAPAVKSPK
ncbi:photosynthetic complex assembly protein PuhC [soil metagenome]